ncbi:Aste57867_14416 [Aphanomyces stellatus]|uniref:Serine/threonine-protein phosphatase n=1 Tax=Aphanomyces stellatus TaxID=120398 RepID=A0A485L1F2_9STRA|nr:hypothetical protein As57867_014362 [Aphanomyces stellatus]VFT91238.1 Aste57867_14416 [Aphanomyces stellatus]
MMRYGSNGDGQESTVMSIFSSLASCCLGESIFPTSVLAEGPLIKKGDYAHFRYFVLEASGLLKYYEITLRHTINACGDIVYHIPSTKLTQTDQLSARNLRGTMVLHPSFCAKDLESPQHSSSSGLLTREFRSNSSAALSGPNTVMRCFRRSKEILVTGYAPTGTVVSWKLQATTLEHYDKWTRAFRIAMRPAWIVNVTFCQICHASFGLFDRPHHCRQCGSCVCLECSHLIDKLPLLAYMTPVRICIDCDPMPEAFAPDTKVLVYGKHAGTIVAAATAALVVEFTETGEQRSVPVVYVERYSEMVLAANRIKCCLRAHLAYRLFRTQLHFHTWSLLETLQEHQTVKIVKIIRSTISVNELASLAPSYEERINPETTHLVEESYRGVHLGFPLTENQVLKLSDAFRSGLLLHGVYVTELVQEVLNRPPRGTMTHVQIPKGVELIVVGDLHGQFEDLMTIFDRKGVPSRHLWYVFNGDFVDRGLHGVEVICTLLSYWLLYPDFVFLNRGNHEASVLNQVFGFGDELKKKYPDFPTLFDMFESVFNTLPLCTLVQDSVFIVHGGLPCEPGVTLKDIQAIDHLREIPTNNLTTRGDQIFSELMWNDPQPMDGKTTSKRGCGFEFGPNVTKRFCDLNRLRLIIRSHESHEEGFEIVHDGLVLSVFSASSYCGFQTNKGAYVVLTDELKPYVVQYHSQALQKFTSTRNWRTQASRFEERTLWSLRELIGKKHRELTAYFSLLPPKITHLQWKQGLVKVLGIPLHYLLYLPQLVPCPKEPLVDTERFLIENELDLPSDRKWIQLTMNTIWNSLQEPNVTKAFEYFDRSRKGKISFEDLKTTLRVLGLMKPEPVAPPPGSSPPRVLGSSPPRVLESTSPARSSASGYVTDQMAFELMHRWDRNQDGVVDMQEFQLAFWKQIRATK